MLQHNHWGIDEWVPLQNIGAQAGGPQDWCTPDPVCRNGAQTTDFWIHYSLLQCYYLPVNVRCLRDRLSDTDSGSHWGTPFEAPFVDFFAWQNLHRIFSGDISKKMTCSKFWPHVIRALRTCVPCLMVNPALCAVHYWKQKIDLGL